jgi:hypothetical protein
MTASNREADGTNPARSAEALHHALLELVVKRGVGLGGLPDERRLLALALAWRSFDAGWRGSEPQVNEQLKRALEGPMAFTDVDHVELRRWLVDCGFLSRDGFGREYAKVQRDGLPPRCGPAADAVATLEVERFVRDAREAVDRAKAKRRQSWLAREASSTA